MKKKFNLKQSGFTLIELMIVIAIIGILAALAMPAYQDYIARTQATEALIVTAGIRSDIATEFWSEGKYPSNTPPNSSHIFASTLELKGKYFSEGGAVLESETGIITVTFDKGANKQRNVTMTPKRNPDLHQIITWVCGGTIQPQRLPSSCQGQ